MGATRAPALIDKPCQTFNQALTVVQAGGEILVQDPGDYGNGFTINKSVTIDAGGFNASVTSTTATDLCTISAGATDTVVLRGISFHGAGVGINAVNVTQVGNLHVEHCSMADFAGSILGNSGRGVNMPNGGNLFVTGTDVRGCEIGIDLETSGATPAKLFAHDSRFTECFWGVLLYSHVAAATGWVSNCTASLCGTGFRAGPITSIVDLTLTNCRAIGNGFGIFSFTFGPGSATIRIANCVVTGNQTGISTFGVATVIGTSPGTNLIAGNGTDGTVASAATLQ